MNLAHYLFKGFSDGPDLDQRNRTFNLAKLQMSTLLSLLVLHFVVAVSVSKNK